MLEAELTNDIEMQQIIEISALFFLFWVTKLECRPRADGEEFQKKKEVCVHKITIYKNLSQFCNIYQGLKDPI